MTSTGESPIVDTDKGPVRGVSEQAHAVFKAIPYAAPQSEDCFTLNIWTPGLGGAPRSVMVWIHGGAFSWGSARNDLYDGDHLVDRLSDYIDA